LRRFSAALFGFSLLRFPAVSHGTSMPRLGRSPAVLLAHPGYAIDASPGLVSDEGPGGWGGTGSRVWEGSGWIRRLGTVPGKAKGSWRVRELLGPVKGDGGNWQQAPVNDAYAGGPRLGTG